MATIQISSDSPSIPRRPLPCLLNRPIGYNGGMSNEQTKVPGRKIKSRFGTPLQWLLAILMLAVLYGIEYFLTRGR